MSLIVRIWLPGALLLLGVVFWTIAGGIDAPGLQPDQLTPWFWPRAMLLGLMVCCAIRIFETVRGRPEAPRRAEDPAVGEGQNSQILGVAIVAVLAYVFMTSAVGFPLATLLFLIGFSYLGGWDRAPSLLAVGVLGTLGALYLFVKVVYLPLPKGWGPFQALTIAVYRTLGIF